MTCHAPSRRASLETLRDEVDPDHARAARRGERNRAETDRAETEDPHGVLSGGLHPLDRLVGGTPDTGEHRGLLEIDGVGQGEAVALRGDHAVRGRTVVLRPVAAALGAEHDVPQTAVAAGAAADVRIDRNPVAGPECPHTRPGLLDHAAGFMPRDRIRGSSEHLPEGHQVFPTLAVEVHVRAADRGGLHAHPHLSGARFRGGELPDFGFSISREYHPFHSILLS